MEEARAERILAQELKGCRWAADELAKRRKGREGATDQAGRSGQTVHTRSLQFMNPAMSNPRRPAAVRWRSQNSQVHI